MKKDIEWLKNEVNELPIRFLGFSMLKQQEEFTVDKDDVLELIDQLDESGTLSDEWINENAVEIYADTADAEMHVTFRLVDLQKLLVPKQEVIIDKEDAENIVQYKEMGWTLSHLINDYGEDARHDELLAKAWLAYPNIGVEEEQKYIVSDNSSIPLLIKNDSGKIMSYDSQIAYNNSNGTIELTEQEIKDYDPRYWAFRKPVEEME